MAFLFGKMDVGNGLLDRFLICFPQSYRPLPQQQIAAMDALSNYDFDITSIYEKLTIMNGDDPTIFYLDENAQK